MSLKNEILTAYNAQMAELFNPVQIFEHTKKMAVKSEGEAVKASPSRFKGFKYRGSYPTWCKPFFDNSHVLVAGCTGSGKSNFLHILVQSAIVKRCRLILIDPKGVELWQYRRKALFCAQDKDTIIEALEYASGIMAERFAVMRRLGQKKSNAKPVYIFIDELADLLLTDKKRAMPLLQHIGQMGRACKVFLVMATQCPNRKVLATELQANIDIKVALRCASPIESRLIIGAKGAESLPRYGEALVVNKGYLKKITIPKCKENI